MELADVPRHRPLAFDKMESLIKEMQDPETGVPVRSQKLFLTVIPSAFMGYDLVEWLMDRFNLDEANNGECYVSGAVLWAWSRRRNPVDSSYGEKPKWPQIYILEAINLANQLCQYGYFFPVNDLKNLVLKDDSSLYRFQSPYYWPWQPPRVAGGSSAPTLGPDNVEYAIYLVKRTLRNKQRHGLEDYEQEALANLKKNLAAKWDFITMQAEEQVRLAKERKKGDKVVSDSQERAYWRVARPPPGSVSALEQCPVPVRARAQRPKKRSIHQVTREIEHLKASLDRTRVKTSIALEALVAYSETFAPYDPWLTPPQPSNPWVSDDTLFWQINSPLVEVPSEKRVQRWALSMEELVSDPTGLQEFTSFLRKEYSHENIRFWLAVVDLRRSSTKQIPKKLQDIYEEFLKPGAPCEINIDGATAERVTEGIRSGSRYALDHAADHVYGLLLKKDCYPRFIRSDHFQRLLTEGRNVHQKKAKFFNFGGQVKKKPVSAGGSAGLGRRRGSDRSLSGSAHELAISAAQPPRAPEPPSHSHSQSNLADIPFRDPLDDDTADVLPWESSSREGGSSGHRRRQDSAADSGSSSSDVSAAVGAGERRRLPQQSTLDGGLRGAPPPLRRLSAVEPRHLAPLASPPERPRPAPAPAPAPLVHAPHPTPTISVSSAPDDESVGSPTCTGSPDDPRSLAHSEEPSSVFASADATPTEPGRRLPDERHASAENVHPPPLDSVPSKASVESYDESSTSAAVSDSRDSDRTKSVEDDVVTVRRTLSREASISREVGQISNVDLCSTVDESIKDTSSSEPTVTSSRIEEKPTSLKSEPLRPPTTATKSSGPSQKSKIPVLVLQTNVVKPVSGQSETVLTSLTKPKSTSETVNTVVDSPVLSKVPSPEVLESTTSTVTVVSSGNVEGHPTVGPESSPAVVETSPGVVSVTSQALALDDQKSVLSENRSNEISGPPAAVLQDINQTSIEQNVPVKEPLSRSDIIQPTVPVTGPTILETKPTADSESRPSVIAESRPVEIPETKPSVVPKIKSNELPESGPNVLDSRPPVAPLAVCEDVGVDDDNVDKVPLAPIQRVSADSRTSSDATIAHGDGPTSVSDTDIVKRDSKSGERKRNDVCPWEDENSCESDAPFVKTYATLGYL